MIREWQILLKAHIHKLYVNLNSKISQNDVHVVGGPVSSCDREGNITLLFYITLQITQYSLSLTLGSWLFSLFQPSQSSAPSFGIIRCSIRGRMVPNICTRFTVCYRMNVYRSRAFCCWSIVCANCLVSMSRVKLLYSTYKTFDQFTVRVSWPAGHSQGVLACWSSSYQSRLT
jgi:hypothetical protein